MLRRNPSVELQFQVSDESRSSETIRPALTYAFEPGSRPLNTPIIQLEMDRRQQIAVRNLR
jgi:hypothetical protein